MFGAEITSGWDYDILPGADPGFQESKINIYYVLP
jgi:hypothetical protein